MTQRHTFTLLAGIEIAGGALSTLRHGQVDTTHTYGNPAEAARHFVAQGAPWVHVADLDAAAGTGSNEAAIREVLRECAGRAHVQLAGGIRDADSLSAALATRASRIVLDTSALAATEWVTSVVAQHGDRIALGITANDHRVHAPDSAVHDRELLPFLAGLPALGAKAYVVSDIDAKGLRKAHDRHALDAVCRTLHGHVVSDGGVFRLGDLHALTELIPHGLDAAIIDAALYTGGFTWAEAEAAIQERFDLFFWGPPQP